MNWTNDPPTEPGQYWFYGDAYYGTMGCHFFDPPEAPTKDYILVEVFKVGGGSLMAKGEGQFIPLRKFIRGKNAPGYVGYWAKTEFPEPPKDFLNIF